MGVLLKGGRGGGIARAGGESMVMAVSRGSQG